MVGDFASDSGERLHERLAWKPPRGCVSSATEVRKRWTKFVHVSPITKVAGTHYRCGKSTLKESGGPFRLDGIRNVYASPVAAAGRVYITDLQGTTLVISDSDTPEVLGLNRLDEVVSASAALVGRELFLRGERHLYAIAEE